ncbi:MAG: hypothetical protein AAB275_08380 [Deltaproteobacteria bacterium]
MNFSKFKILNYKFLLFTIHCSLLTALVGCQPPALTPKGAVINKTNPNFLKEAGVDEKTNPHIDRKCQVCHTAPDALLAKENPADNEIPRRRLMRTDLINLCSQCHKASAENEHVVGVETKLNRQPFPLDHQGRITCAITCHDVHTKDTALGRFFLRQYPNSLCFSCHDV